MSDPEALPGGSDDEDRSDSPLPPSSCLLSSDHLVHSPLCHPLRNCCSIKF